MTQKYYIPFAEYLADNGYGVITFDYRGIGKSRPASLKGFQASISDWGRLDMSGVWEWVVQRFPDHPKYIMAHSMGGQILGLMENHRHLKGIIAVATTMGNWRNYSGSYKYYAAILWSVFFPLTASLLGYVPLSRIGMGQDLPRGVAEEWYEWCKGNESHTEFLERHGFRHSYYSVRIPYKIYYIEKDVLASVKTIPQVIKDFKNAMLDIEEISSGDNRNKSKQIGHLGFFSRRHRETLWLKPLALLNHWNQKHSASTGDSTPLHVSSFKIGRSGKNHDKAIPTKKQKSSLRREPGISEKDKE